MKQKTLEFLEAHQSGKPSTFQKTPNGVRRMKCGSNLSGNTYYLKLLWIYRTFAKIVLLNVSSISFANDENYFVQPSTDCVQSIVNE